MESFPLIYLFLFFLNALRYFSSFLFHATQYLSSMQVNIPNMPSIRPYPLNRYLLGTNSDILLPVRNAFAKIISKILNSHLEFPAHDLVDNFVKDIDETNNQKKGLVGTVQYEACEFFDELELAVCAFAHFLLKVLNGVAVEVGDEKVYVELIKQAVVGVRVLDYVLDGLF